MEEMQDVRWFSMESQEWLSSSPPPLLSASPADVSISTVTHTHRHANLTAKKWLAQITSETNVEQLLSIPLYKHFVFFNSACLKTELRCVLWISAGSQWSRSSSSSRVQTLFRWSWKQINNSHDFGSTSIINTSLIVNTFCGKNRHLALKASSAWASPAPTGGSLHCNFRKWKVLSEDEDKEQAQLPQPKPSALPADIYFHTLRLLISVGLLKQVGYPASYKIISVFKINISICLMRCQRLGRLPLLPPFSLFLLLEHSLSTHDPTFIFLIPFYLPLLEVHMWRERVVAPCWRVWRPALCPGAPKETKRRERSPVWCHVASIRLQTQWKSLSRCVCVCVHVCLCACSQCMCCKALFPLFDVCVVAHFPDACRRRGRSHPTLEWIFSFSRSSCWRSQKVKLVSFHLNPARLRENTCFLLSRSPLPH